jgi:hypothetical protein
MYLYFVSACGAGGRVDMFAFHNVDQQKDIQAQLWPSCIFQFACDEIIFVSDTQKY